MPYLLVAYGAAFVAAGFALLLQARVAGETQPVPRLALALLSAFALVHGASEWARMAVVLGERGHEHASGWLVGSGLALLALSFALLFAFGSALLVRHELRLAHVVAGGLVPLVLCAVLLARLLRAPVGADSLREQAAEAVVRYALGIPACLGAAVGLFSVRRTLPAEETRTAHLVALAAGVFLCYGMLAGAVVPRAPFPPASLLNSHAFAENFHLPVEALRAACALGIVLLLSEAFIVEPFHRLGRDLGRARTDLEALARVELRAPLAAVEQAATALQRLNSTRPEAEAQSGIAEQLQGAVRTARQRIADLLDASELEAHRLRITPEPFDLRPLLVRAAESPAGAGLAGVRLECPERLPSVMAEPGRIEQVLRMLIARARERADGASDVVVVAEAASDAVSVSVTSRGESIPAYDLPYVFAGGGRPGDSGLRLVRALVEAMGGRIEVESRPAASVTFRLGLPLAPAGVSGVAVVRRAE